MIKYARVAGGDVSLPRGREWRGAKPARMLLQLIRSLCGMFGEKEVYHLPGSGSLYVLFPHSCCEADALLEECGRVMGEIGSSVPVTLGGRVGALEDAEIRAKLSGEEVLLQKFSATGDPFDLLYDLCLQIRFQDEALCGSFGRALRALGPDSGYAAFDRAAPRSPLLEEAFERPELFLYRYVSLDEGEADYPSLLASLDVGRIAALWRDFFESGVSHEEFARLWEALEERRPFEVYPWEFALKLALERQGVSLQSGGGTFGLCNRDGKRIYVDFERGGAAERLLLKFIFPCVPEP